MVTAMTNSDFREVDLCLERRMTLRVGVIDHRPLDSQADGVAAYLRTFFKYAQGAEFIYWGGMESTQRAFGDNLVQCNPIGSVELPGIHIPRRIAIMLALWRRRHEIAAQSDVLFVHNSDWVLPFAFLAQRKPIVLLIHRWNPPTIAQTRGWLRYGWLRFSDSLAVRIATKVILVSQEGYAGMSKRYKAIREKFLYIPTFVDADLLHAPLPSEAKRRLGVSGSPVLLSTSRLAPEKQVDKIIAVFAKVKKALPDATLLIVGDGDEKPMLESLSKSLRVDDSVRFEGPIPHERIGLYLAAADFFLLLSNWEGMSIGLLEALVSGVPAIVSDVADHKSIVTDNVNGIVVNPARLDDAAAWIVHTYQSGQISSLMVRQTSNRYSAHSTVPRVVEVLYAATESHH